MSRATDKDTLYSIIKVWTEEREEEKGGGGGNEFELFK